MIARRLHTFFGIDDDLQAFAQDFLNRPGILSRAGTMRYADNAQVAVLHQEGRFQVELCCVAADSVIPDHVHPQADTIEVTVSGAIRLRVNGVDPFASVSDQLLYRFARGRGIRINHTDVHGANVPAPGAMFLSIQRWADEPRSVLTDYRGGALGPQHRAMLG